MESAACPTIFPLTCGRGYVVSVIRLDMQLKFLLSLLCMAACACLAAAESNPARMLASAPLRFEPSQPDPQAPAAFVARGCPLSF